MVCQQAFSQLSRGTKQGDPLCPYLFILVSEILFKFMSEMTSVKGIKTGDIEIKHLHLQMTQHFFVRNKESLNKLLNIMRKFGNFVCYMQMLKNVKLVGLGVPSVAQTSQLIVRLLPSLEVQ